MDNNNGIELAAPRPLHEAARDAKDDAFTLALKDEIKKLLDEPLSPATVGMMSKILDASTYAPSSMNETFGAKAIRELVAMFPQLMAQYRPEIMVRAIDEARKLGNDELAKKLEATLTGEAAPNPETEPQAAE